MYYLVTTRLTGGKVYSLLHLCILKDHGDIRQLVFTYNQPEPPDSPLEESIILTTEVCDHCGSHYLPSQYVQSSDEHIIHITYCDHCRNRIEYLNKMDTDVSSTQVSTDQSVIITHCKTSERVSNDYVNILPREWFGDNSFETTQKTTTVFEFLQTHTESDASLFITDGSSSYTIHCGSEASLCTQCKVQESAGTSESETTFNALLHNTYKSESSLCTSCREHEALENGSYILGHEEQSLSMLSLSSLCTQCRDSSSLMADTKSSSFLSLCSHCGDEKSQVQYHSGSTIDPTSVCYH